MAGLLGECGCGCGVDCPPNVRAVVDVYHERFGFARYWDGVSTEAHDKLYKTQTVEVWWCATDVKTATSVATYHDFWSEFDTVHLTTSCDGLVRKRDFNGDGTFTDFYHEDLFDESHEYIPDSSPCLRNGAGNYLTIDGTGFGFHFCNTEVAFEHRLREVVNSPTSKTVYAEWKDFFGEWHVDGVAEYTLSDPFDAADAISDAINRLDVFVIDPDDPEEFVFGTNGDDDTTATFGPHAAGADYCYIVAGLPAGYDAITNGGFPMTLTGYNPQATVGGEVGIPEAFQKFWETDVAQGGAAVAMCIRKNAQSFQVLVRKVFVAGPSTYGPVGFYPQEFDPATGLYRFCGDLGLGGEAPEPECQKSTPTEVGEEGAVIEPTGDMGITFLKCLGYERCGVCEGSDETSDS